LSLPWPELSEAEWEALLRREAEKREPKTLTYRQKLALLLGGAGSGNFGHAGRPGEVGGSAPGDPAPTASRGPLQHTTAADMQAEPLPTSLSEAEHRIRGETNEHAVLVKDGKPFLVLGNDQPDKIALGDVDPEALRDAVLTHNHPRGLGLSVSDGHSAAKFNVQEIRAVTATGTHSLRRTGQIGIWPPEFRTELDKLHRRVQFEFQDKLTRGQMTLKDANTRHYTELYTRLAQQVHGIAYTFEEIP
jgi:hypothetical protein